MIVDIDVSFTSRNGGAMLPPVKIYTNCSVLLRLRGVPMVDSGATVTSVVGDIKLLNGQIQKRDFTWDNASRSWISSIFEGEFRSSGRVASGLVIKAHGVESGWLERHTWVLGVADIEAYDYSDAAALPFDTPDMASYVQKNDDIYIKSEVIDGVQHYKKQVIVYDSDMESWGAEWIGDYILENGVFVEV